MYNLSSLVVLVENIKHFVRTLVAQPTSILLHIRTSHRANSMVGHSAHTVTQNTRVLPHPAITQSAYFQTKRRQLTSRSPFIPVTCTGRRKESLPVRLFSLRAFWPTRPRRAGALPNENQCDLRTTGFLREWRATSTHLRPARTHLSVDSA